MHVKESIDYVNTFQTNTKTFSGYIYTRNSGHYTPFFLPPAEGWGAQVGMYQNNTLNLFGGRVRWSSRRECVDILSVNSVILSELDIMKPQMNNHQTVGSAVSVSQCTVTLTIHFLPSHR